MARGGAYDDDDDGGCHSDDDEMMMVAVRGWRCRWQWWCGGASGG
ncbi:hypothetical protein Tco_1526404, partial [Tanacetum coccineum]